MLVYETLSESSFKNDRLIKVLNIGRSNVIMQANRVCRVRWRLVRERIVDQVSLLEKNSSQVEVDQSFFLNLLAYCRVEDTAIVNCRKKVRWLCSRRC